MSRLRFDTGAGSSIEVVSTQLDAENALEYSDDVT